MENQTPTPPSQFPTSPTTPDTSGMQQMPPKKSRRGLVIILVSMVVLVAAAAGVYWFVQRQSTTNEEIKIGLMMAFTGGSSQMGYGTSRGVELAKKQFGAENVTVIQADSKCDPKSVPQAMNYLQEQGVVAIIGEGCSSASLTAVTMANNFKIPLVSPSASSPALTIPDDYFFRVIPSDQFQGKFLAQTMYDKGFRRIAVFYTNEPYGSGISQVFRDQFESLGGKIVATTTAEPDVIALDDQIKAIKDSNPEAVFIAPNSVVSGTAAIRLARQADITVPLYGADIFYDPTIIQNAPNAVEGLIVSTFPTGTAEFKSALEQEFQTSEQLYAASQAYDAFTAIYRAIELGARTGEEIKNLLPTINFNGVSAFIEFDENGEISYPDYKYDIFQVQNGQFEVVEQ